MPETQRCGQRIDLYWGEPERVHIDGDVRPTSRGMFVHVCIWPRGAFVLPMFPRSHVRVNIDRAP